MILKYQLFWMKLFFQFLTVALVNFISYLECDLNIFQGLRTIFCILPIIFMIFEARNDSIHEAINKG